MLVDDRNESINEVASKSLDGAQQLLRHLKDKIDYTGLMLTSFYLKYMFVL